MSKHVMDHREPRKATVLPIYLRVERAQIPHDSTRRLITRLRDDASGRVAAFTRIARGLRA